MVAHGPGGQSACLSSSANPFDRVSSHCDDQIQIRDVKVMAFLATDGDCDFASAVRKRLTLVAPWALQMIPHLTHILSS